MGKKIKKIINGQRKASCGNHDDIDDINYDDDVLSEYGDVDDADDIDDLEDY